MTAAAVKETKDAEQIGDVANRVLIHRVIDDIVAGIEESVADQAPLAHRLRKGLESGLPVPSNVINALLFHSQRVSGLASFLRTELQKERR